MILFLSGTFNYVIHTFSDMSQTPEHWPLKSSLFTQTPNKPFHKTKNSKTKKQLKAVNLFSFSIKQNKKRLYTQNKAYRTKS